MEQTMSKLAMDILNLVVNLVKSKGGLSCFVLICVLGVGGYVYADKTFASAQSVENLNNTIEAGFRSLTARMNLSDVQGVVRDIQEQIRQKEREIADLDMVIAEIDPNSDSASLLRARAFTMKQELASLRSRLTDEQQALLEARRAYQAAVAPQ